MSKSAAVLCNDKESLKTLKTAFEKMGVEHTNCRSQQEALELVMTGRCSILIVDFELPGGPEAVRTANLLPLEQKPALIALEGRVWPGTGQAFQSGAGRILYRPLQLEPVLDALKSCAKAKKGNRRKAERHEIKTLVYLELPTGTLAGISIDIGEHGLALRAPEPVPMGANLAFRCVLPGSHVTVHGHADVIWTGDHGRAGLFFSKLAPAARKHLKHWMQKCNHPKKNDVRDLLPPADAHVEFAATE